MYSPFAPWFFSGMTKFCVLFKHIVQNILVKPWSTWRRFAYRKKIIKLRKTIMSKQVFGQMRWKCMSQGDFGKTHTGWGSCISIYSLYHPHNIIYVYVDNVCRLNSNVDYIMHLHRWQGIMVEFKLQKMWFSNGLLPFHQILLWNYSTSLATFTIV